MSRPILLSVLLFFFFHVSAQDLSSVNWYHIDTSIKGKRNLSDINDLVQQLKQKALAGKNYFTATRCYYYQSLIADRKTEDSFYFRNSSFIDSFLMTDPANKELQVVMHLLQAKRLSEFSRRSLRFNRQRYERQDIPINYAVYTNNELDSIADIHFQKAKMIAETIPSTDTRDALWLSSDTLIFMFKPSLYDIAISEQLLNHKRYYHGGHTIDAKKRWLLQLSAAEFIPKMDSLYKANAPLYDQLKYYKEWMVYHQSTAETYFFIEMLARKSIYELFNDEDDPQQRYQSDYAVYLRNSLNLAYPLTKAYGVCQLSLMWYQQSKKYFPGRARSSWYRGTSVGTYGNYDTTWRYHAAKAVQLFGQNKTLLAHFPYLEKLLLEMEKQVLRTDINISMELFNIPGEPLLAELVFRNVEKLHYRIVRIPGNLSYTFSTKEEAIAPLLQLPMAAQRILDLPVTSDHNSHALYLKLDGLAPGKYVLLFSSLPLNSGSQYIERAYFTVTSIGVVNNSNSSNRVFILDRKTGLPLEGATVSSSRRGNRNEEPLKKVKNYTVNKQGYVTVTDKSADHLDVHYKNDTLYYDYRVFDNDIPEGVYDKEEDETLEDFYEDNATIHIFTDRAVYRPGQTVHYKAIFLTSNKNTGELMVMNKANMGNGLFKSVYKKWLKNADPGLYIKDPFDREADTIKIKPNEYGSLSGSFRIPKTAATGAWRFDDDDMEIAGGSFSVEEYKRPTYEISIENPEKELLPGDTFSIKVSTRSFADAALSNVRIHYTLTREGYLPYYDSLAGEVSGRGRLDTLADTFTYTNAEGETVIVVNDTLLKSVMKGIDEPIRFFYTINAEAVDVTGESHETSTYITVSSRPVSIELSGIGQLERNEKNSIVVTASDENAGTVEKDIHVKIYREKKEGKLYGSRRLVNADLWLYDKQQLQQWFPMVVMKNTRDSVIKELMLEKTINTGKNESLVLDPAIFTAGSYSVEAECVENGKLKGEATGIFTVFDLKENKLAPVVTSFHHIVNDELSPGDTITYYSGHPEKPVYSIYELSWYSQQKKTVIKEYCEIKMLEKGINSWKWKIPADATDEVLLTQVYLLDNDVSTITERITLENKEPEPEIIIEQYRKKLSPGAKETFTVSIKTKSENMVAELMTTLYDASLDRLEGQYHYWEKPASVSSRYLDENWNSSINFQVMRSYFWRGYDYYYESSMINPVDAQPLWWPNPLQSGEEDVMADWNKIGYYKDHAYDFNQASVMRYGSFQHDMNPDLRWSGGINDNPSFMAGSWKNTGYYMNGLTFGQDTDGDGISTGLDYTGGKRNYQRGNVRELLCPSFEISPGIGAYSKVDVVVTAVPFLRIGTKALSGSYSSVNMKDIKSLLAFRQPLVILDGVPFEGDLDKIDPATITMGIVLKGADAVELYGPKAANGVLVLSTKGDIIFPASPAPPVPVRKNFNETAFFFPAIYADKDGYYRFTFTMPESVTEWNWKMLAHTKSAKFVYAEKKLNTQLPLMVQPNMPRLLYQGDRIILRSRITNLDSVNANGKAVCKIEDVVTGEDITSLLLAKTQNDFSVGRKGNISSAFEIKIPKEQLNPIKVLVSVQSQNFTDGEEHIIPVLSPKILVRESQPFVFAKSTDTTIRPADLPADAELYGVGISMRPRPQSALINALPYLANYSFDCAEQTFNKMLAHIMAIKVMRDDEDMQKAFDKMKTSAEKEPGQKDELTDDIKEQTMPWLEMANKTKQQQKQLFELLDTVRAESDISNKYLSKLYKLQNKDGGLTWFEGGLSNPYISSYVLAGFGKLQKDKLLIPADVFEEKYDDFIKDLVAYSDKESWGYRVRGTSADNALFNIYARSFWNKKYPQPDSVVKQTLDVLNGLWKNAGKNNLKDQSILVISTLRYFDKDSDTYKKAMAQLRSIEQLAIRDAGGIRWKEIADSEDMSNAAEETVVLILEALEEGDIHYDVFPRVIRWLLTAKSEEHWSSTKATAAVINMLGKVDRTSVTQTITAKFNDQQVSVTDDMLNGNTFAFVKAGKLPAAVELKNRNEVSAAGNMIWYYFSPGTELSKVNKEVSLKKELFRYNETTGNWEPVTGNTVLKIADKVKVILTIETSKALRYVYISDKRAAAFEPKENNSGYRYEETLSYYLSVRDEGLQFFSDYIPGGRSVIHYEMVVAQEGDFLNGPAVLQCMYKPEVNAYSNGLAVKTNP